MYVFESLVIRDGFGRKFALAVKVRWNVRINTHSSFHLGSAKVEYQVAELLLAFSFGVLPDCCQVVKLTFEG